MSGIHYKGMITITIIEIITKIEMILIITSVWDTLRGNETITIIEIIVTIEIITIITSVWDTLQGNDNNNRNNSNNRQCLGYTTRE